MMGTQMSKQNSADRADFFGVLFTWLKSLPTDLKILIEMIGDDDLDLKARSSAVGIIIYILSPIDLIPEKIPILGYIDDVIILRIALAVILEIDANRAEYYREKYPETFDVLDEQIVLLKQTLGALYSWLKALVEKLPKRRFHGKSAEDVASSEQSREEMFDEVMEYAANVNVDPKAIEQAILTAPPNRIVELLSSGLEGEQKRQMEAEGQEQEGISKRLVDSLVSFRKQLGSG